MDQASTHSGKDYFGRLLRAASANVIAGAFSKFVPLIVMLMLSRRIDPGEFGRIAFLQSTIMLISVISSGGIGLVSSRVLHEFQDSRSTVISILFLACLAISVISGAVILALLSYGIMRNFEISPTLFVMMSLTTVCTASMSLCGSILLGLHLFKANTASSLMFSFLNLPTTILLTLWKHESGFLMAQLICAIAYLLATTRTITTHCVNSAEVNSPSAMNIARRTAALAAPLLLASFIPTLVLWLGNILLSGTPSGYAEIGLYNVINQWKSMIILLPGFAIQAILPLLTSAHIKGDREQSTKLVTHSSFLVWSITVPIAVGLMAIAPLIAHLYGKQFSSFPLPFVIAAGISLIQCVGMTAGSSIQSEGKMWTGFYINLLFLLLFIAILYPFKNHLTVSVVNGIQFIAYYLLSILTFKMAFRGILRLLRYSIAMLHIVVAITIGVACLYLLPSTEIPLIIVSASAISYFGIMRLLYKREIA